MKKNILRAQRCARQIKDSSLNSFQVRSYTRDSEKYSGENRGCTCDQITYFALEFDETQAYVLIWIFT